MPRSVVICLSSAQNDLDKKNYTLEKVVSHLIMGWCPKGANLEKLHTSTSTSALKDLFSYRLSQSDRLLLMPIQTGMGPAWILLEVVLKHHYSGAHFMQAGALNHFLAKHSASIVALTLEHLEHLEHNMSDANLIIFEERFGQYAKTESALTVFESVGAAASAAASAVCVQSNKSNVSSSINIQEYIRCGSIVPRLSGEQNDIFKKLKQQISVLSGGTFLGMLTGAPGSGKTLLASCLLQAISDPECFEIYYIAQSPALIRAVQENIKASRFDEAVEGVVFCHYHDVFKALFLDYPGESQWVEKDSLEHYFQIHREDLEQYNPINFAQFAQECELMAMCENSDEYKNSGRMHSSFHGNEKFQNILWSYYANYINKNLNISGNTKYNERLSLIDLKKPSPVSIGSGKNQIICIDEALDLSRSQLEMLRLLAVRHGVNILYLCDGNQDLSCTVATTTYLRKALEATNKLHNRHFFHLSETHRCSQAVAQSASAILKLKQKLLPHGEKDVDRLLEAADKKRSGAIYEIKPSDVESVNHLKPYFDQLKAAVICNHSEDKIAAKALFETPLVFTVEEIKGLEFQIVILYHFLTHDTLKLVGKIDSGKLKNRRDSTHLISTPDYSDSNAAIHRLNHLYTALTRAQDYIVIYQKTTHPHDKKRIQEIFGEERQIAFEPLEMKAAVESDRADESLQERALSLYQQLIAAGRQEQAAEIAKKFSLDISSLEGFAGDTGLAKTKPEPKPKPKPKPDFGVEGELETKGEDVSEEASLILEFVKESVGAGNSKKRKGKKKGKKNQKNKSTIKKDPIIIDFTKPLKKQLGGKSLKGFSLKDATQLKYAHIVAFLTQPSEGLDLDVLFTIAKVICPKSVELESVDPSIINVMFNVEYDTVLKKLLLDPALWEVKYQSSLERLLLKIEYLFPVCRSIRLVYMQHVFSSPFLTSEEKLKCSILDVYSAIVHYMLDLKERKKSRLRALGIANDPTKVEAYRESCRSNEMYVKPDSLESIIAGFYKSGVCTPDAFFSFLEDFDKTYTEDLKTCFIKHVGLSAKCEYGGFVELIKWGIEKELFSALTVIFHCMDSLDLNGNSAWHVMAKHSPGTLHDIIKILHNNSEAPGYVKVVHGFIYNSMEIKNKEGRKPLECVERDNNNWFHLIIAATSLRRDYEDAYLHASNHSESPTPMYDNSDIDGGEDSAEDSDEPR